MAISVSILPRSMELHMYEYVCQRQWTMTECRCQYQVSRLEDVWRFIHSGIRTVATALFIKTQPASYSFPNACSTTGRAQVNVSLHVPPLAGLNLTCVHACMSPWMEWMEWNDCQWGEDICWTGPHARRLCGYALLFLCLTVLHLSAVLRLELSIILGSHTDNELIWHFSTTGYFKYIIE